MNQPHEYLRFFHSVADVPKLDLPFPRPATQLHQIEMTSHCNLRCVYCPSRHLPRPKVHMSREHFERCLAIARYYRDTSGQQELNLAGIGESTQHPDFIELCLRAREVLGPEMQLTMATNGVGYTEELVSAVAPARLSVWVSLHRPEKAALARLWWAKHGMLAGESNDPSVNSQDWAGQVDWPVTQRAISQCMWLRYGMLFVLADGRVSTCCYDASGAGVIGSVDDPIGSWGLQPYSLCSSCHQVIGVVGHQQWPDGKRHLEVKR